MITPRLKTVIDNVKHKKIADIGTDHAYIPIFLAEKNLADRVIATDINEGPLNIARDNIKRKGLENKIETRLGGGLSVIRAGESDDIIIAGMGGILISEIIENDIDTAKQSRLVLQPMNAQYELRKYLVSHGFRITGEDLAVEGFKVYNVITAERGEMQPFETDFEYQIPKYLAEHKYFKDLCQKKRREFTKVIKGLENSDSDHAEKLKKYRYWKGELDKYEG